MRIILGLDAPQSGTALIGGRPYRTLVRPLREVGALLDAGAVHGGRTAQAHLAAVARSNGIGRRRVAEVLALTGLAPVARRRIRGFSLGMRQRLGLAAALLGDPPVLIFDEPVNGLDPEGVRWVRGLLRALADQGRTVLVSSHQVAEIARVADHLVVIGRGRLIAAAPLAEVLDAGTRRDVLVRSPRAADLAALLTARGAGVTSAEPAGAGPAPVVQAGPASAHPAPDGGGALASCPPGDRSLAVTGLDAGVIGDLAAAHGIPVHELTPRQPSLEDVYLALTGGAAEYRAAGPAPGGPAPLPPPVAAGAPAGGDAGGRP